MPQHSVLARKIRESLMLNCNETALEGEIEMDGAYVNGHVCPANKRIDRVAVFTEGGVQPWLQHLLDQRIRDRRDAQLAQASIRLRDRYPSHRTEPVHSLQQLVAQLRPRREELASGLFDIQSIDARRPFVGFDSFPRLPQVPSRQRRLQQR